MSSKYSNSNPSRRQAAKEILKIADWLARDQEEANLTLDEHSHLGEGEGIRFLCIDTHHSGDSGLRLLSILDELTDVGIINSTISSEGLAIVCNLPRLRYLSLFRSSLPEESGRIIGAADKLEHLVLTGCKISPADIEAIKALLPKCKLHLRAL